MRIAYVVADSGIPVFGTKGASVHVREMVRALGADHTVDLFCAASGAETVATGEDHHLERDRRRLATVERMKEAVDRACRTTGYDLIYERYSLFSDIGASIADRHGIPFLLEVNAPLIAERQRVEALPLAPLARQVEKTVFSRAGAVLAVSRAIAAYVVDVGAASRCVHVIPNGVDTHRFHPGVSGDSVRTALDLGGRLVVGFAGSLKPWHGVDLLLEAFARVAGADWTVLLVGDGPERSRLEAQVEGLEIRERVIFTGAVPHDEVPAHVAAMDIAVAPYRSAANFYFSPLKLYEYLATGRTVVASHIGQITDVIRHGHNGYLVTPDDVVALSRALSLLGGDARLRDELARRAPHGLTTWEQIAHQVVDIAQALSPEGPSA